VGEDEKFAEKNHLQKLVDECNRSLEVAYDKKAAELTQ
jgi:ribosome recycling factor